MQQLEGNLSSYRALQCIPDNLRISIPPSARHSADSNDGSDRAEMGQVEVRVNKFAKNLDRPAPLSRSTRQPAKTGNPVGERDGTTLTAQGEHGDLAPSITETPRWIRDEDKPAARHTSNVGNDVKLTRSARRFAMSRRPCCRWRKSGTQNR